MNEKQEGACQEMRCEDAKDAVSAALDKELDGDRLIRLHDHVRECELCAEFAQRAEVLDRYLDVELSDQKDTKALWARINAGIDAEEQAVTAATVANDTAPEPSRRHFMKAGAAAAVLLAAGGFGLHRAIMQNSQDVVVETVNDFLTFRASGRKLHVTGRRPDVVKGWLEARVNFEIPVRAGPPEGFQLAGGRLCSFLSRRLVFLHYEKGERAASLYVMGADGLQVPAAGRRKIAGRQVSATSLNGVTNVAWKDGGLVYVVVSDLAEADVFQFVAEI